MSNRKQSTPTLDLPIDQPDETTAQVEPVAPPDWMLSVCEAIGGELSLSLARLPIVAHQAINALSRRDIEIEYHPDVIESALSSAIPRALNIINASEAENHAVRAWLHVVGLEVLRARESRHEALRGRQREAAEHEAKKAEYEAKKAREEFVERYLDIETQFPGFSDWVSSRSSVQESVEASA